MNHKALVYSTYNQNFDRLFHLLKERKNELGIEELHIVLFEQDSVWNKTYFNKYQKGILVSGSQLMDYQQELQSEPFTLQYMDIPAYQVAEFMDMGTIYPTE